jgi:hypothetical protein
MERLRHRPLEKKSSSEKREDTPQERELKIVVPRAAIEPLIASAPAATIDQWYFPKDAELFQRIAQDCGLELPPDADVSQARIRKQVEPSGEVVYTATFKGQKNLETFSRSEFEVVISQETAERLLPQATNGHLQKRRHFIEGIVVIDGQPEKQKAEIDLLLQDANGPAEDYPIAFFEIECDSDAAIDAIREGNVSFSEEINAVLRAGKEASGNKSLSMTTIARKGADRDGGAELLKEITPPSEQK